MAVGRALVRGPRRVSELHRAAGLGRGEARAERHHAGRVLVVCAQQRLLKACAVPCECSGRHKEARQTARRRTVLEKQPRLRVEALRRSSRSRGRKGVAVASQEVLLHDGIRRHACKLGDALAKLSGAARVRGVSCWRQQHTAWTRGTRLGRKVAADGAARHVAPVVERPLRPVVRDPLLGAVVQRLVADAVALKGDGRREEDAVKALVNGGVATVNELQVAVIAEEDVLRVAVALDEQQVEEGSVAQRCVRHRAQCSQQVLRRQLERQHLQADAACVLRQHRDRLVNLLARDGDDGAHVRHPLLDVDVPQPALLCHGRQRLGEHQLRRQVAPPAVQAQQLRHLAGRHHRRRHAVQLQHALCARRVGGQEQRRAGVAVVHAHNLDGSLAHRHREVEHLQVVRAAAAHRARPRNAVPLARRRLVIGPEGAHLAAAALPPAGNRASDACTGKTGASGARGGKACRSVPPPLGVCPTRRTAPLSAVFSVACACDSVSSTVAAGAPCAALAAGAAVAGSAALCCSTLLPPPTARLR